MIYYEEKPQLAMVAAAFAAGIAVELRQDGSVRYIGPGEHAIELDALGDRLADVLPCERGPVAHPATDPLPATPAEYLARSGHLITITETNTEE